MRTRRSVWVLSFIFITWARDRSGNKMYHINKLIRCNNMWRLQPPDSARKQYVKLKPQQNKSQMILTLNDATY